MVCNLTLLSRNVVRLVREVGICEAYAPAAAAADLQRLAQRESRERKPQRPKDCSSRQMAAAAAQQGPSAQVRRVTV